MKHLALERFDKKNFAVGILLVIIGILIPLVINIRNFGIYPTLFQATQQNESMYVIYAALKLVALNSLRSFPHYLGAFFIGESLHVTYRGKPYTIVRLLVICSVIPLVYWLIDMIYGIHYDFGVPAVLLIAMLIMLEKANLSFVNLSKKALMVILLITAMQFNDVMPALSRLPFGRGETSMDIKMVSSLLGADGFLQFGATLMFLLLFFSSILLCKLIIDENNLRTLTDLKEQNDRMLTEQRMRMMEERTYRELQHLVHDLKTPLTSAQALVSVVKLGSERDNNTREVEYLTRVESAMEHMNTMISDILYEDHRSPVETERLINLLLAQISNASYARVLQYNCAVPHKKVEVNEIRMLRALINLIENAYYAIDSGNGRIRLEISAAQLEGTPMVCFQIIDNGAGIPTELLESVWEGGFSTRSSHGLGLLFVRQVIERNQGKVKLESTYGHGTTVTILLPEYEEERVV